MTQSDSPGVKVCRPNGTWDAYPTGLKVYVKDNHLFVQSYDADIAVYSEGQWRSAELVGNRQP